MKKILILSLITAAMLLVACSEENNTAEEFPNWQQKNENYFNALYADVSKGSSSNNSWKILRKWSLQDDVTASASDHIVVRVIENGEGTETPLYTDSVAVIYSGRLLPSTSYPTGFVFDKSYVGEFHPQTAKARGFRISGLTDGFSTALQYMKKGDRWEIYVPANLGYGALGSSSAGIPGYSVLIFDMMLVDIYRK